jgi:hypothetical protein
MGVGGRRRVIDEEHFVFGAMGRILTFLRLCGNEECLLGGLAAEMVFLPRALRRKMTQCAAKSFECSAEEVYEVD